MKRLRAWLAKHFPSDEQLEATPENDAQVRGRMAVTREQERLIRESLNAAESERARERREWLADHRAGGVS